MTNPNGNKTPMIPMTPTVQLRNQQMRPQHPSATPMAERTAAAFAELRALEENYQTLVEERQALQRRVDQQDNKIELLEKQLDDERHENKAVMRKLVRLAEAMANIGSLTKNAEVIMKDAADWLATESDTTKSED